MRKWKKQVIEKSLFLPFLYLNLTVGFKMRRWDVVSRALPTVVRLSPANREQGGGQKPWVAAPEKRRKNLQDNAIEPTVIIIFTPKFAKYNQESRTKMATAMCTPSKPAPTPHQASFLKNTTKLCIQAEAFNPTVPVLHMLQYSTSHLTSIHLKQVLHAKNAPYPSNSRWNWNLFAANKRSPFKRSLLVHGPSFAQERSFWFTR